MGTFVATWLQMRWLDWHFEIDEQRMSQISSVSKVVVRRLSDGQVGRAIGSSRPKAELRSALRAIRKQTDRLTV